ncbi:MAG: helix-turn-helix domain-containing protein [Firmicutes bacterium]|nr:helix-turn-helix domain-containing protein [Bacillota bacterium]
MPSYIFYTVEEITEILKVTQNTLYNYIKSGSLKAVKIGKYWRIQRFALEELLETSTNIPSIL